MKNIILAVAAALIGAGNGLASFANDGELPDTPAAPGSEGTQPKRGRGRPAGTAAATTDKAEATADDPVARWEANKKKMAPYVEKGMGEQVKAIIATYSKTGLKDLPLESQAAWEKDLAALDY